MAATATIATTAGPSAVRIERAFPLATVRQTAPLVTPRIDAAMKVDRKPSVGTSANPAASAPAIAPAVFAA